MTKIWQCKIGEVADIPFGADLPMREAVARAYSEITGRPCDFIFSGWGAELTEGERAVVENRPPDPSKCDLYDNNPAALGALIEAAEGLRAWAASLTVCDMNEIVADGGVTVGMVVTQEAGEQVRRIDRALAALRGGAR